MHPDSTLRTVCFISCACLANSLHADVYYGPEWNEDPSLRGYTMSGGSLELTKDATMVYGTYTRGASTFENGMVVYLDTKPGGFSNNSQLRDYGDSFRKSASAAADDGNRCSVNFAPGFGADYAIVMSCELNGGRLYELVGNGTFLPSPENDQVSVGFNPAGNKYSSQFTFSFSWASIGLSSVENPGFSFETLNVTRSGWANVQSLEVISGTEGFGNTITFSSVDSFGVPLVVPEPSVASLLVLGLSTWLVRRKQ